MRFLRPQIERRRLGVRTTSPCPRARRRSARGSFAPGGRTPRQLRFKRCSMPTWYAWLVSFLSSGMPSSRRKQPKARRTAERAGRSRDRSVSRALMRVRLDADAGTRCRCSAGRSRSAANRPRATSAPGRSGGSAARREDAADRNHTRRGRSRCRRAPSKACHRAPNRPSTRGVNDDVVRRRLDGGLRMQRSTG